MTTKNLENEITFHHGEYVNDVFSYFIRNFKNPKIFLSLIAFVRNLIEYSENKSNQDYLTLTSCLHRKEESENLLANDIFNIFQKKLIFLKDKRIDFGEEKLMNLIVTTANSIKSDESNEIALENKICLAIAIRLEAEKYLINKLPDFDLTKIKKYQTKALFKEYCKKYPDSNNSLKIDKVNLMTPENIHINAFMFEPLIDMSMIHLMNLYEEIKSLN